ncbi:MAG: N-acetylmuramoyl-L-alanine amidase [Chlamydiia bacterium]|nr:N-acetylmuramoyl-L-alanine amidase [Chlamydiia bacterium]
MATRREIIFIAVTDGEPLPLDNIVPGSLAMYYVSGDKWHYDGDNWLEGWTLGDGEGGAPGPQGPQGIPGEDGKDGKDGEDGEDGIIGKDGEDGAPGPKGDQGDQGITGDTGADSTIPGPAGSKGDIGDTGAQGDKGDTGADSTIPGPQGLQGLQGDTGANGSDGKAGEAGSIGADGPQGPQGLQGLQGLQGANGADSIVPGPTGPTGDQGLQGNTGDVGSQGLQGLQGTAGNDGAKGEQGAQGDKGDTGIQGLEGPQGPQGAQGAQGLQGLQGLQGATGENGVDGIDGVDGVDACDLTDNQCEGIKASNNPSISNPFITTDEVTTITDDFVEKVGDTMTGALIINNGEVLTPIKESFDTGDFSNPDFNWVLNGYQTNSWIVNGENTAEASLPNGVYGEMEMEMSFMPQSAKTTVSFDMDAICKSDIDFVLVFVNGVEVLRNTGVVPWKKYTFHVQGADLKTISFKYRVAVGTDGNSKVLIDNINIFPENYNLVVNGQGSFHGTVKGADPVALQDFVTRSYLEKALGLVTPPESLIHIKVAFVVGHIDSAKGKYSDALGEYEQNFWGTLARGGSFLPGGTYLSDDISSSEILPTGVDLFIHEDISGYTDRQIAMASRTSEYDLVFEQHFNAFDGIVGGTETLSISGNSITEAVGQFYCDRMASELGYNNRGAKPISSGDGYGFLQKTKGSAILLEAFFGDTQTDTDKFNNSKYKDILSETIAKYEELYSVKANHLPKGALNKATKNVSNVGLLARYLESPLSVQNINSVYTPFKFTNHTTVNTDNGFFSFPVGATYLEVLADGIYKLDINMSLVSDVTTTLYFRLFINGTPASWQESARNTLSGENVDTISMSGALKLKNKDKLDIRVRTAVEYAKISVWAGNWNIEKTAY